jgi:hypothetical protein
MNAIAAFLLKTLVSAATLVAVAEIAKRAPAFGGLLIALPLGTLIAVGLMAYDGTPRPQIAAFVWSILLLVPPTIVFFAALLGGLAWNWPIWLALTASSALTLAAFWLWIAGLKLLGITLQVQI